jgi:hypothetical protein
MRLALLGVFPLLVSCQATLQPVPIEWNAPSSAAPQAARVLSEDVSIEHEPAGARIVRNGKPLTPLFPAIESADVSKGRGEVVFAARRTNSFDIGLVSTDGSNINWIPEDPADEVGPRWAPRGNKASYILRNPEGDFVRTVHIPTATMLTVDFPLSVVTDVRWDMVGEEFSITYETPDASTRVETLTYAGERRRVTRPPETRLELTADPFASRSLLLRPRSLRYDEKVPLIVWIADTRRNAWDEHRARLLQNVRAACIVTEKTDDEFWRAVHETSWIDPARIFVVNPSSTQHPAPSTSFRITGDLTLPANRYRRTDRTIRTHPSVVKSFAAGFIAGALKGTLPLGHR